MRRDDRDDRDGRMDSRMDISDGRMDISDGRMDDSDDRVTRIEERASAALAQSRSLLAELQLLRSRLVTRAEQDEAAAHEDAQRYRLMRDVRKLFVIALVALILVAVGVVRTLLGVSDANGRLDTEVRRVQNAAVISCTARNDSLLAEKQLWQTFINTEKTDTTQPPQLLALKVQDYTKALGQLPAPFDCSIYNR